MPAARRSVALLPLLAAAALAGCEYTVPGLDGAPGVESARVPPVETDLDIEGYFIQRIAFEDPADGGEYECFVTEYAEGRRRDDIEDSSCRGCDRYYRVRLYLLTDSASDTCGLAGLFPFMTVEGRATNIGLTPIDDADGSYAWLANYGVSDLLYTDWTPWGPDEGDGYSFFMYAYPYAEALEGEHYLEGEWEWYSYYYYPTETDQVEGGVVYLSTYAVLGAYN